jgi:hypothetical protein
MSRPMILRFRTIRLGWCRSPVAQAATIAPGRPKIGPMNVMSPHDQARERERWNATRAAFLAGLPPEWRERIFMITVGTNDAGAVRTNIELKGSPISVDMALAIEKAAKEAFGREVIFNTWWSLSDLRTDFGGPWAKRI